MYLKESALEKQIFAGPFLGPFMTLLTLAVALFYYSPEQMELPLTGLTAVFCSWKWRWRGVAIGWVLLGSVSTLKIVMSDVSLWWTIVFALSLGLSCLVTALSQTKVRDHLEWKYQDAIEQQSRLAMAESRLNTILQAVQQERDLSQATIDDLQAKLKEKTSAEENAQVFIEAARKELGYVRKESEILAQDSLDVRQKALMFQEKAEEAIASLKSCEKFEELYRTGEKELSSLKKALGAYQHQIASYKEDLGRSRHQDGLIKEMGDLIDTLTREKKLLESSLTQIQGELESLKGNEAQGEVFVNEDSPTEMRRLEGFYRQLRGQFEEKSRSLDETRKELFLVKEQLAAIELEQREQELLSPRISIHEHICEMARAENELKKELEISQEEVARLYNLVGAALKKSEDSCV